MHSVYILFLFGILMIDVISLVTSVNTNDYLKYLNGGAPVQRDIIQQSHEAPAWASLYRQLEESHNRHLRNAKYRNVVYPHPSIDRSRTKPGTRQPQPLLSHSTLMKYFYKQPSTVSTTVTAYVKPKYTISPQNGDKQQYFQMYPRASSSTPYYPPLSRLVQESSYPDMVQLRKLHGFLAQKENENSHFIDTFIQPTKENNINSIQHYPIHKISPDAPYGNQRFQVYRDAMKQHNLPMQLDTSQNAKFLPPHQPYQRTVNENLKFQQPQISIQRFSDGSMRQFSQFPQQPAISIKQYATATIPAMNLARNVPSVEFFSPPLSVQLKQHTIGSNKTVKSKLEEWDKKDFIPRIPQTAIPQNKIYKQSKKYNISELNSSPASMVNSTKRNATNTSTLSRITSQQLKDEPTIHSTLLSEPKNSTTNVVINHKITNLKNSSTFWRRNEIRKKHIFHPINIPLHQNDVAKSTVNASKRGFLPFESNNPRESYDDGADDDDIVDNDNEQEPENSFRKSLPGSADDGEDLDDVLDEEDSDEDAQIAQNIHEIATASADPSDIKGMPGSVSNTRENEEDREEEVTPLREKPSPKDTMEALEQGMVHNIATSRENVGENTAIKEKKNSPIANGEEAEAAKEDQEAKQLISSKDNFRIDDQPEILGFNGKGISSTPDKESLFANSPTQNIHQDNNVGIDTTDPLINEVLDKHHKTPLEGLDKPMQPRGKAEDYGINSPGPQEQNFEEDDEEEYQNSNQQFVNDVKSDNPSLESELQDATENSHDGKKSSAFEMADKDLHHVENIHQEENNAKNLNPLDFENKDDEEKSALLDPERAQERALKLSTESELRKRLEKPQEGKHTDTQGERKDSKPITEKKLDDLSAEEALHALNGAALPSKQKEKVEPEHSKEAWVNSITSPSEGPSKNPEEAELVHKDEEDKNKVDTGDKKSNDNQNIEPSKVPVVANASVSKEVVDVLKSLGQIKTTSDSASSVNKQGTPSSNNQNTTAIESSIKTESEETKEAVHDLGIAISILEKKLSLINEAKATGSKKNIFIVDDSTGNKESTGAAKSTIELGSSVRLLKKVMNVAERFKKKNSVQQKQQQQKFLSNKRNKISKISPVASKHYYNSKSSSRGSIYQQRNPSIYQLPWDPSYQLRDFYHLTPSWKRTDIEPRRSYNNYYEPYQHQQYFSTWYDGNQIDYQR